MAKNSYRADFTKRFLEGMVKRKDPDVMLAEAQKGGLQKTLGAKELIILGISAIIGSGIFAIVGVAAARADGTGAGPALMLSMIIAAIACVFSALCYSEFAAMIPVAGGAYVYTFSTMGEFMAWMIGWVLMLEFVIAEIAVSCAWSNYLVDFIQKFPILPEFIKNPPVWLVNDPSTMGRLIESGTVTLNSIPTIFGIPFSINIPAILIVLFTTLILTKGTKDSTVMATIMVIIKLAVISIFVVAGLFYVQPENWTPFAPHGMKGIFNGAFTIFFAYIGFDALATTAEECKNPQKDLPIGIIGSLIITTIIYVSIAFVLTGLQDTSGAVPEAFLKAPMAFVMSKVGINWAGYLISIGSIAGLTSVVLVMQLAATRILLAMSRDNFLPKSLQAIHPKFKTPALLTWLVGAISVLGVLTLDLNIAADLCNFGTLTSFIVVCVAVLILRKTEPDRPRPFRVPFSPLFPILGILCCGGLMYCKMCETSPATLLFPVWIGLGALIYLHYGYKKNRVTEIFDKRKNRLKEYKKDEEIAVK